jgi:hypothetical protein
VKRFPLSRRTQERKTFEVATPVFVDAVVGVAELNGVVLGEPKASSFSTEGHEFTGECVALPVLMAAAPLGAYIENGGSTAYLTLRRAWHHLVAVRPRDRDRAG